VEHVYDWSIRSIKQEGARSMPKIRRLAWERVEDVRNAQQDGVA
jgi:hypothetical protein